LKCCQGSCDRATKPPAGINRSVCANSSTRSDPVELPAPADRGVDPGGNANHDRHQRPAENDLQRARQTQRDLADDGIIVDERGAEIAPEQTGEEAAILRQDRPVEAELVSEFGDCGGVGRDPTGREQEFGRVARHNMQRHEHDRGDDPGQEQRGQDAAGEPGASHPK
jgi:hypothetical protein